MVADPTNNTENRTATLQGAVQQTTGITTLAADSIVTNIESIETLHYKFEKFNPYSDQQLSLALGHMNKIRDLKWLTNALAGAHLATLSLPEDMFEAPQASRKNIPLLSRLAGYRYMRAGVKLRFTVNSTVFHSGKLLVSWMPYYSTDATRHPYKSFTIYQAANNHPFLIDCPSNGSVTLEIPWITPNAWLDLKKYQDMKASWGSFIARCDIWCLHPLRNISPDAPNPDTVTVTVEAAFMDAKLSGFQPANYFNICPPALVTQSEQIVKSGKEMIAGVREEIRHLSESIAEIPLIGGTLLNTVGSFTDGLGLNKPTSVAAPTMVQPILAPDFCHSDGLDMAQKLSLDPCNKIATNPGIFNQKKDCMNIYDIAKTPSLVKIGTFTSASAIGSILFSFMCDPMTCGPAGVAGSFCPTYLSYISFPFTYFSGGLKFRIDFTCSKIVSCKVRLSYTPAQLTATSDLDYLGGEFPSRIIDITGPTQTEFTIPYLSPYLTLPLGEFIRSGITGDYRNIGWWNLSILNPVIGAQGTSTIDYAIWIAAAEDYRLYKPREITTRIQDCWVYSQPSLRRKKEKTTKKKANKSDDDDFRLITQCDVQQFFEKSFEPLTPVKLVTHSRIVSGEAVSSLRSYMHRYVHHDNKFGGQSVMQYDLFPGSSSGNVLLNQHLYFLHLFYYWRGSVRFKIIPRSPDYGFGIVIPATQNLPTTIDFNSSYNTFCGAGAYSNPYSPNMCYEIPWYHQVPFTTVINPDAANSIVPPDNLLTEPIIQMYRLQVNEAGSPQNGPAYSVYIAIGDDFSAGVLSSPPLITMVE